MVMRLHHQLRPQRPRTRIVHAPDANAWTEIPVALGPLRGQRIRWHVGLFDNLRIHWRMIGRRRYGAVGLWSLPYALLFEAAGPLLQAAGMVLVVVLVGLQAINWPYAVALFVVMLLVGQLQTAGAILIEEVGFRRYTVRDLMVLAGWSLVELLWYRPLNALWRLWATVLVLTGRRPGWGTIPRGAAFTETPETRRHRRLAAQLPRRRTADHGIAFLEPDFAALAALVVFGSLRCGSCGAPARTTHDDITLLTTTLPEINPGQTAWVSTLWRGASEDATSFELTVVQPIPKGITRQLSGEHQRFSSLYKQSTLLADDTDYSSIKVQVGDDVLGNERIKLNVEYQLARKEAKSRRWMSPCRSSSSTGRPSSS